MKSRQRLSWWIAEFGKYQEFTDGLELLMLYYDDDISIKTFDFRALLDMLGRWQNLIDLSLNYGNKYQIANFVPFARNKADELLDEMLRQSQKRIRPLHQDRPRAWRLDAKQVKCDIDSIAVFESYFPDMKQNGSKGQYKAKCRWHDDKTPSLVIHKEGWCHCFSCNASFDTFGMIMDLDRVDFATALNRAWELGR